MINTLKYITAFLLISAISTDLVGGAVPQTKKIKQLFSCISEESDTPEKVDCYIDLARIYRKLNKDSSLIFCDEAYRISKEIGYGEGLCDALYRKSQTLENMGNLAGAAKTGEKCLMIADSIGDERRTAKAYYQLAGLYDDAGRMTKAFEYYQQALYIFKDREDTVALVAIYNGLGNYYSDVYALDSAAYYYHKAIELGELIGHPAAFGRIPGNLGIIYKGLGDYETAKAYALQSLEYSFEINDLYEIINSYSRLGNIEEGLGNIEAALRYFDKADSILSITQDSLQMMEVAVNRASLYFDTGRKDLALPVFRMVEKYYKRQHFIEGLLALWQNIADVYLQSGNTNVALKYHDSIIALAAGAMELKQIKGSYEEIFEIQYEQGNFTEALEAYIQYEVYADSIFDLEKAELINNLRLKYEKEKDQLEILELKHQNLQKTKERNLLFFMVVGSILLGVIILAFLWYNHRKNKIIAAEKIKQLEEEKKHLAARFLVEGEERERKRVAMELHDNLGVLLSATKMQFSEIRDKDPDSAELITKATKYLEQASSDVRKISHNLMPGLLTKLGLFEALEELFENLDEQEGIDAFMDVVGPKNRLDENIEIMIYRMVQEIVNNTLKHAAATKIDLTIIIDQNELNISYADNGKGFDVEKTLQQKSLGLQSIQSRVKFLNGLISIKSNHGEGEGTVYRICIPISKGYCENISG